MDQVKFVEGSLSKILLGTSLNTLTNMILQPYIHINRDMKTPELSRYFGNFQKILDPTFSQ